GRACRLPRARAGGPGHRQAPDSDGRSLRARQQGPGGDGGRGNACRRRQRRRLPDDHSQLQVELSAQLTRPGDAELPSLYEEPEENPAQIEWGALEFHDVFKIFRSGPAETVGLRGLDLRIEPEEMVGIVG